jgi:hypothetical protein
MERVKLLLLLLLLVEGKMMGVAVVVMLLKWMLCTVAVAARVAVVAVDRGVDNAVRGILSWYSCGFTAGGGGEEWLHVMCQEHLLLLLLLQVRRDGGVDGVGGMRM